MAARLLKKNKEKNGGLAQLGEHLPCKQGVESSNLLVSIAEAERELEAAAGLYLENRILKNNLKYQNDDKTSEKRNTRTTGLSMQRYACERGKKREGKVNVTRRPRVYFVSFASQMTHPFFPSPNECKHSTD